MAKIRLAKGRSVPLDSFGWSEIHDFVSGWHPPLGAFERSRSRWASWAEFFADYDSIEDELIERLASGDVTVRLAPGQQRPFGSTVRGELQPGEVFDAHAHCALLHAHVYTRGDGHAHDLDLGAAIEVRGE